MPPRKRSKLSLNSIDLFDGDLSSLEEDDSMEVDGPTTTSSHQTTTSTNDHIV